MTTSINLNWSLRKKTHENAIILFSCDSLLGDHIWYLRTCAMMLKGKKNVEDFWYEVRLQNKNKKGSFVVLFAGL